MIAERVNPHSLLENIVLVDRSLASKAADIIRDKIIRGECPMGSRLPETEFADALQVSRASIREAFMILESDGLLVRNTNRSTVVVSFSPEDVINLCELRLAVEEYCVKKCMRSHTLDVITLEEISSVIENQFRLRGSHSNLDWIKSDMRFHESFVIHSGNDFAMDTWRTIRSRMCMLLYHAADAYSTLVTPQGERGSHERLLQLVQAGDEEGVSDFLRVHVLETASVIRDSFR